MSETAGSVCFERNGTQFVATYSGTHLDIYNASEKEAKDTGPSKKTPCVSTGVAGHNIKCACVHPSLDIIFTGGEDVTVCAWNFKSGEVR